jgi:hypothetical protein
MNYICKTVGELRAVLLLIPDTTPLRSEGTDEGGYDAEFTSEVHVEPRHSNGVDVCWIAGARAPKDIE